MDSSRAIRALSNSMHVLLITSAPAVVDFVRAALDPSRHTISHVERADRGTVRADVVLCGPDVDVNDLEARVSEALPSEVVQGYNTTEPIPKRGFGARIDRFEGG